jgi:tRNA1Val (adenine37-N6)-methyltransferase
MKVCTDACLFGSMHPAGSNKILDIGTGTGLLALMIAQKDAGAVIDAVEIDAGAAEQAKQNFKSSPWAKRLSVINTNVLDLDPGKQYDHIISNPPFFEDDLRSPDKIKNDAKHDTSLSLADLLQVINKHLTADGSFAVLLPYHRVEYFIEEAVKNNFHLTKQVLVRQTELHDHFRGILFFSRNKAEPERSEMCIKNKEGNYTPGFISALKDYYLYL